jgi:hypothetical protein
MQRNIDTLTKTIREYLDRNSLTDPSAPWEIKKSNLGGFGIFASRPIEIGEVIFKDHPVILGPRAALTSPLLCVNCFDKDNLKPCERQCGLRLCSLECQNSSNHQKECKIIRQWQTRPIPEEVSEKLFKVLSPIRSLLLSDQDKAVMKCLKAHRSDQHGFEVNVMKNLLHFDLKENEEVFMRFVCSVLDSNAFEVIVGHEDHQSSIKGLYPLGSLANHSCTPNTIHVFDEFQHMIVRATVFIPKGAEIFHSYSRFIWATPTRRFHLYKTKHFLCKCRRCQDPTEFGSYVSAVLCKVCKVGRVIPIDPLVQNGKWQCEGCGEGVNRKDVASLSSLLGSALNSFSPEDIDFMLRFIDKKLKTLVSENNETVVEMKYKIIWMLGHQQGFTWTELSDNLLFVKEKFCKDLLALLETLRLGQCKMRGLLLYEFYRCCNEAKRRQVKSGNVSKICENDMKNLLSEVADILMYDVGAPAEIKKLWPDEMKLQEQ